MARKRTRGILALAGAALAAVLSACGRGSDGGSHSHLRAEEVERVVLYYTDAQGQYSTIEDQEVIRRIVGCINEMELEEDAPFLQ